MLCFVMRFRLPLFFVLAFILSWSIWLPMAVQKLAGQPAPVGSPLNALAVWAPALAAIIVSLLTGGKPAVDTLFVQLKRWRAGLAWYLAALLYPAAVWFIAYGIDRLLGNAYQVTFFAISRMFRPEQAYMVVVALVFVLPNTLGEELGWRGFALPELLKRFGPLAASLILGVFWAAWHLPMWLMYGKPGLPLAVSFVWTVAIAVVFTWIYRGSGKRLPLAWLFHSSLTATGYLLSSIPTFTDDVIHVAAACIVGFLLVRYRDDRGQDTHSQLGVTP